MSPRGVQKYVSGFYLDMNHFYDLPEELQEKIYLEAHFMKFCVVIDELTSSQPGSGVEYSMQNCLYNTNMDKKEIENYFFCLDWLDGKRLNITLEDVFENKYYRIYYDFWDAYTSRMYYNRGGYI